MVNESALFRRGEARREPPGGGLDGEAAPAGVPGEDRALLCVRCALLRVQVGGHRHRGDVRGGALRGGPELGDVLDGRGVRRLHPTEERPEVLFDDRFEGEAVPAEEVVEVVHVHATGEPSADDGDDGVEELGGGGHGVVSAANAGDGERGRQGPTSEARVMSPQTTRSRVSQFGRRECGETGHGRSDQEASGSASTRTERGGRTYSTTRAGGSEASSQGATKRGREGGATAACCWVSRVTRRPAWWANA